VHEDRVLAGIVDERHLARASGCARPHGKGASAGKRSIRVDDQYRIVFRFQSTG